MFGSVLDTVYNAAQRANSSVDDSSAMQELWVPIALAITVLALTAIVAFPVTRIIAANKEEAVRRAIFACIMLGNANTMPLLVMQSLCSEFSPFQFDGKCFIQSMGYASLFMTVVNMIAVCSQPFFAIKQFCPYSFFDHRRPRSSLTHPEFF